MHTFDFHTPQSSACRFQFWHWVLELEHFCLYMFHRFGGRGGGWGGGGGDEAIGATQTSNSEHQSILYGIRVPNSMPP